jgi:hypothetical protein
MTKLYIALEQALAVVSRMARAGKRKSTWQGTTPNA